MEDSNGNVQRVTNALLKKDIEILTKSVNALTASVNELTSGMTAAALVNAETKGDVKALQKDVEEIRGDISCLRTRVNNWSGINSVGTIIAGILGAIGLGK